MKQYKLITATNTGDLERMVNDLIKEGWELYADPFWADHSLGQALVKSIPGEVKMQKIGGT